MSGRGTYHQISALVNELDLGRRLHGRPPGDARKPVGNGEGDDLVTRGRGLETGSSERRSETDSGDLR